MGGNRINIHECALENLSFRTAINEWDARKQSVDFDLGFGLHAHLFGMQSRPSPGRALPLQCAVQMLGCERAGLGHVRRTLPCLSQRLSAEGRAVRPKKQRKIGADWNHAGDLQTQLHQGMPGYLWPSLCADLPGGVLDI